MSHVIDNPIAPRILKSNTMWWIKRQLPIDTNSNVEMATRKGEVGGRVEVGKGEGYGDICHNINSKNKLKKMILENIKTNYSSKYCDTSSTEPFKLDAAEMILCHL